MLLSKSRRRAVRHPLETFIFKLAAGLIPFFPRRAVVGFANLVGLLAYALARRKRAVGMANIGAVFNTAITDMEKRRILRRSFCNLAQTTVDFFWFSRNTEKRVRQYQKFVPSTGPFFEKRARILITAHAGNWELIGLESGLLGITIASVAAQVKNEAVDALLNQLRQRTGQCIIPREGALRTMVSRLRNQGTVAFVLDQNTSEEKGGIWVDFLGMPTPVSSAPAHLAYRTGSPIIFAFSQPIAGGKYEVYNGCVIHPPAYDKCQDHRIIVKNLTQKIMDVISEHVRQHPESWLWTYKHWRRVASGTDPGDYPIYK